MFRHNNSAFVTKGLRKAIMKQLKLKNLFNKQRTQENWVNCKMQWNHCVNLLLKTKKNYFANVNVKDITDSNTFWKTIKPNFNKKGSSSSKIILSERGSILNDNKEICNTMNNYFKNITKTLNLKPYKCSDTMDINEIISTFDNHVSIKKIKEYFPDNASTQILSTQRFLKMKLKKKFYI